jgi:lipopolysaccharide transport system ATP-binding protein
MTEPVINVEDLWKKYSIGSRRHDETFYDVLSRSITAPFRRSAKLVAESPTDFWALRGVELKVQRGEILGIVGRNGAGKSTLLKVLSRITAPTRGRITVRGRMTSLLEVGTGFHPELSGRENVFLNGALLGMSRRDISRKLDAIIAFAEIEKFVDTPVKRYSSGMYVRLAFSVAAHMEPDILVIDEVLAVGDAEFQRRCLGKLEDTRNEGKTVLVVSHHIPTVMKLCRSAVWLDQGAVVMQGPTREVCAQYMAMKRVNASTWRPPQPSGDLQYEEVSIVAPQGCTPDSISASHPFRIEFRYRVVKAVASARIAIQIRNSHDLPILSSANTDGSGSLTKSWPVGEFVETCEIPGHLLVPGTYSLTISMPTPTGDAIIEDVCSFTIAGSDSLVSIDGRQGIIAPQLEWQVNSDR